MVYLLDIDSSEYEQLSVYFTQTPFSFKGLTRLSGIKSIAISTSSKSYPSFLEHSELLFHGTSASRAANIMKDGFLVSSKLRHHQSYDLDGFDCVNFYCGESAGENAGDFAWETHCSAGRNLVLGKEDVTVLCCISKLTREGSQKGVKVVASADKSSIKVLYRIVLKYTVSSAFFLL